MSKKTSTKKAKAAEPYTHVDRSNGQFLRESELNAEKPHISPISRQATVERMSEEEAVAANG